MKSFLSQIATKYIQHAFLPFRLNDKNQYLMFIRLMGGHGGRVVTLSPPTSEAGVRFPARPQVGKLVVACRWLAVYSTEPDQLYVLVSSARPTTRHDMTCTVLKAT